MEEVLEAAEESAADEGLKPEEGQEPTVEVGSEEEAPDQKPEDAKPDGQPEVEKEEKAAEPDLFEMPDGSKVTYDELIAGQMRDKDYRQKTMELARQRREYEEKLAGLPKQQVEKKDSAPDDDGIDPEQLQAFEKIAKKLGFVKGEELAKQSEAATKQSIGVAFLEAHPEYSGEKDTDGLRYKALEEELALYDRSNVKTLAKVLEKAHADVVKRFASSTDALKKAAQFQRGTKAATVGSGGSSNAPAKESSEDSYTPEQVDMMKKMGVWDE